jgi:hypothetical protein
MSWQVFRLRARLIRPSRPPEAASGLGVAPLFRAVSVDQRRVPVTAARPRWLFTTLPFSAPGPLWAGLEHHDADRVPPRRGGGKGRAESEK